jgi:hypothetical protein
MYNTLRIFFYALFASVVFTSCSRNGTTAHKPSINPENVPEYLRALIPMATKWGIGDDGVRDELEKKATKEEKAELEQAIKGKEKLIHDWLDSFPKGEMSDEAGAFMYMTLALEEM